MNRVARKLEEDSSARFAFHANDIVVWTEAADYENKYLMQTELQAAVLSSAYLWLEMHLHTTQDAAATLISKIHTCCDH